MNILSFVFLFLSDAICSIHRLRKEVHLQTKNMQKHTHNTVLEMHGGREGEIHL